MVGLAPPGREAGLVVQPGQTPRTPSPGPIRVSKLLRWRISKFLAPRAVSFSLFFVSSPLFSPFPFFYFVFIAPRLWALIFRGSFWPRISSYLSELLPVCSENEQENNDGKSLPLIFLSSEMSIKVGLAKGQQIPGIKKKQFLGRKLLTCTFPRRPYYL